MDFDPVFRMIVMSDIHYKTDDDTEPKRFRRGMEQAYAYAANQKYDKIDALYVVGDFANRGQEDEMLLFKQSLEDCVRPETHVELMLASHEFMSEGPDAAYEKLGRIFDMKGDTHRVINGLHCIALSCDKGCSIYEKKQQWLREELEKAAADDWHKPIFVFQHPHLSDTVYGSINWGEDDIISILMNYPQVIDFSGHSHAPINDPRSVMQKYFSCFGTGSLSYFELDEFDYQHGTVPPDAHECAQYLIVEADTDNRVRILPFDILSGEFFNEGTLIDKPYDPSSFLYTDARYLDPEVPYFSEDTLVRFHKDNTDTVVEFTNASGERERINSYTAVIIRADNGRIVRQITTTSSYYLYHMPTLQRISLGELPSGIYDLQLYANGFWHNRSLPYKARFEV